MWLSCTDSRGVLLERSRLTLGIGETRLKDLTFPSVQSELDTVFSSLQDDKIQKKNIHLSQYFIKHFHNYCDTFPDGNGDGRRNVI